MKCSEYTAEAVAVLTPADYDANNIAVQFGDQCDVCFAVMFSVESELVKYHCILIRFRIRSGICTPMFCESLCLSPFGRQ